MDISYEVKEMMKKENKAIERALRKNAVPPIKGIITIGKIRSRGIKRCVMPSEGLSWLEQRGKAISPRMKTVLGTLKFQAKVKL